MFTLRGKGNSGKTTVIRALGDWMENTFIVGNPNNRIVKLPLPVRRTSRDILWIITINGITFCLHSRGDIVEQVSIIDDVLIENPNIDVVINACHTKGRGLNHIRDNYENNSDWQVQYIDIENFWPVTASQIEERNRNTLIILQDIIGQILAGNNEN